MFVAKPLPVGLVPLQMRPQGAFTHEDSGKPSPAQTLGLQVSYLMPPQSPEMDKVSTYSFGSMVLLKCAETKAQTKRSCLVF